MKDFKTADERTAWIVAHAEYFTVIRFLGRGKYERHEFKDASAAEAEARRMANETGAHYLMYAVYGTHDTLVKKIP